MQPPAPLAHTDALDLMLPFSGTWVVQNSPADRVPSHGTDMFGVRYAIDFVAVDERGRTAASTSWRTVLATEPPELFVAFGRSVLSPIAGVVRVVHDGEDDHVARRSPLTLVGYALTQPQRVRQGSAGLAGNHVVIQDDTTGLFVAVVHLQRGSITVREGDAVARGHVVARCGNSGNSTQPHVHLQVMDNLDMRVARGVPLAFTDYRETRRGDPQPRHVARGVPVNGSVVEPVAPRNPA